MTEHKDVHAALLAFQAEMPTLRKTATNPHFHSKFCPLDEIVETVTPLLYKHGLTWSTMPSQEDGKPVLRYVLQHAASGSGVMDAMPLLLDKPNAQGQGSAITYARRYAITAVLNLVADEDDDGNGASSTAAARSREPRAASAAQIKRLKGDITRSKFSADDVGKLLAGVGVTLAEGETVNSAVQRLTADQASGLIDTISKGAVKVGGSDVPAGDLLAHAPAGDTSDVPYGQPAATGQIDVGA
jgi:hypothetical protein